MSNECIFNDSNAPSCSMLFYVCFMLFYILFFYTTLCIIKLAP